MIPEDIRQFKEDQSRGRFRRKVRQSRSYIKKLMFVQKWAKWFLLPFHPLLDRKKK